MTTQENTSNSKTNAKPTHTLRKKVGYGKQTDFETIGAAWAREGGGFYAFPIKDQAAKESGQ